MAVKFVHYARTSDANGDEESIEAQQDAAASWAPRNGHQVVAFFDDNGRSGTLSLADREGLTGAVAIIESGEAEALLIHRLDRIARALHVQEATLAYVWGVGGRVFEVVGGEVHQDDPDDPMRKAMRQMRGVFNELERGMVVARMQGGRRRAAAQGKYIGGARLHSKYGYKLVDGQYEPDEDEQAVIVRMLVLHGMDMSYRSIGAALTEEGHPPPSGEAWHPSAIMRIVKREKGVRA
jgi:DNA invertase Pin-like site-specific DNA recombinase